MAGCPMDEDRGVRLADIITVGRCESNKIDASLAQKRLPGRISWFACVIVMFLTAMVSDAKFEFDALRIVKYRVMKIEDWGWSPIS